MRRAVAGAEADTAAGVPVRHFVDYHEAVHTSQKTRKQGRDYGKAWNLHSGRREYIRRSSLIDF
jgi:hypothetical protein